jgi:short-subunit dehydrogenase
MNLQKYGPWALIVGGSEGIGAAYARQLAAQGFKLVLTARKTGPLQELADALRAQGAEVRTVSADLSDAQTALAQVRAVTDDIEVGLLIYNAGANNTLGVFVELDPDVYRSVINVTVVGQAEFSHHYGARMRERGRGGIILSGSSAGYMGSAMLATYCGAKAFSRIFSEALWLECEKFGVDVLHLTVGFTATPAMERLGIDVSQAQAPDEVAQEALNNIANGPVLIVGGPAHVDRVIACSAVNDRAATIRKFVIPPRDEMGDAATRMKAGKA